MAFLFGKKKKPTANLETFDIPSFSAAVINLLGKLRNPEISINELTKELELDPGFGASLNQIAYTYLAMENYEKAIEYFKKCVAISPGEALPLDSLADAYFRMGRLEESVAKYKEALEVKPDWGNSYVVISYINALHEDYSEAMKWADQGIAIARSSGGKGYTLLLKGFYYFWLGV